MYHLIIYLALTNPVVRYVRVADGKQWDDVAGALAATPTYADTAIALAEETYINGIPITIPADLPAGDFDMLIYDAASPATTDALTLGRRIMWSGTALIGLPLSL